MSEFSERLDRIRRQQASGPPVTRQQAAAALGDLYEVLTGSGAHADHAQEQVGSCVRCSCGTRAQGRLTPAEARWYHGGFPGLKRGQQILPPSVTGVMSVADKSIDAPAGLRARVEAVHRADVVYLAADPRSARLFAALAPAYGGGRRGGDLYEVTPDGPVERDPDYLPDDGGGVTCRSATVVRIVERRVPRPSADALAFSLGPTLAADALRQGMRR